MFLYKLIRISWVILSVGSTTQLFCQASPLRKVEKKMTQGNWSAAHQLLAKTLRKDSLNVEAEIFLTKWFLSKANPARQLDSSYQHSMLALRNFNKTSTKQKEKLKRIEIDSIAILLLRNKIDSLAFEEAKQLNAENSYNNFIKRHPFANKRAEAVELRDEVAFLNALRQNTFVAFADYRQRYPQSHRAQEASERFEKLLFETKTKDKKLKSYLAFVNEFPFSPYRILADRNIFELTTCGGDPSDFQNFLDTYPGNHFTNEARNILFHILKEMDERTPSVFLNDSLKQVLQLNQLLWAPIYKNSKYGFIDSKGNETIAPQFDGISEEYKCGSIKEDMLFTSNGLFSRSGKLITPFSKGKDIGYGFIKVGDSSCLHVIHKSGRRVIEECLQNAFVLEGRFLVVKKNGLHGLYALNGRMLLSAKWNSIEFINGVLVFNRNGKRILSTPAQLVYSADGNSFSEDLVFDEVRSIGQDRLLVSNGSLQGIVNSNLQFVVPLTRQSLTSMPFGLVRKINDRYIFTDLAPELDNVSWEKFVVYRQWLVVKNQNQEKLFDTYSRKMVETDPDSLWFDGGLTFARQQDSIRIHINSTMILSIRKSDKISFVKSPDSIRYFFVTQKNMKTVFAIVSGEKIFTTNYDQIESVTSEIFMVTKKNKKGLVNKFGKLLLPIEFDALVLSGKTQLSLLKERKFGLFDLTSHQLIKPQFERNITTLDENTLIAFKDGHYGLIDWIAHPITSFEFDEILPWVGNVIWVRNHYEWKLFDFSQSKNLLLHVKNFHVFKDGPDEKLAFVRQENFYGVLSSERGMIIPTSFSYITNLSSEDEPLYFTAKEVEEASIVVVIYYDRQGKILRKQVYEEEEYARITCEAD